MVNSEDFAKRLEKIIEYYELSAASFADKINVGRSSISHILSGRNKPSLDFVLKIVNSFPEVELYWLLNGKGNFPKSASEVKEDKTEKAIEYYSEKETKPTPTKEEGIQEAFSPSPSRGKPISKIVIFYKDGSFEAFEN